MSHFNTFRVERRKEIRNQSIPASHTNTCMPFTGGRVSNEPNQMSLQREQQINTFLAILIPAFIWYAPLYGSCIALCGTHSSERSGFSLQKHVNLKTVSRNNATFDSAGWISLEHMSTPVKKKAGLMILHWCVALNCQQT